MKFIAIALTTLFAASVSALPQAVRGSNGNCGFPNGPDCKSLGDNKDGLEQFTDGPDSPGPGCCLLPLRCGNGDGGEVCVRV